MAAKSTEPVGKGGANAKGKPRGKPFRAGERRAGRKKGVPNKATVEVKEASRLLVEDPSYRVNLQSRLRDGTAAPAVEAMLWHYAYGKPVDKVEMTGPNGGPLTGAPQVVLYMPDNGRGPGSAPDVVEVAPTAPGAIAGDAKESAT